MEEMTLKNRRAFLRTGGAIIGGGLLLPHSVGMAQQITKPIVSRLTSFTGKPYGQLFKPTAGGLGMLGPWGEVRAAKLKEGLTPYFIETAKQTGRFDYSGRTPYFQFRGSSGLIKLTLDGIAIGSAKPVPWNKTGVTVFKNALKKDRTAMKSALCLRSSMASSFPAIVVATKTAPPAALAANQLDLAAQLGRAAICTTSTVTETIVTRVEETVELVKSAAQRYAECYDKALREGLCKDTGDLIGQAAAEVCAAGFCTAKGFVDVVVGFIEIVTETIEEVTREVTTCTAPVAGLIPNEWNLPDIKLPDLPMKQIAVTAKDIARALEVFRQFGNDVFAFLGPFGKALVAGTWSMTQLPIPFIPGVGIPFGVEVTISAANARTLTVSGMLGEASSAWGAALSALAALSPSFAASAGPLGITANTALTGLITTLGLSAAVVNAMALILAFVILGLLYASAIAAQMEFLVRANPGALADGKVKITHPSIALASIKAATLGIAPAELVPPIVLG
ncbi:MAG: hypothetical protein H6918_04690 [Sphingomonadaceae bacterium]|nr:hypothetical protein [Sphingomonadaceae bacterium]